MEQSKCDHTWLKSGDNANAGAAADDDDDDDDADEVNDEEADAKKGRRWMLISNV